MKPNPRVMPCNVEAEQAVLGSILLDPLAILALDLKPRDFYLEKHATIAQAMLDLTAARSETAPNFLNVVTILRERAQLENVGGAAYLTALLGAVPTASNIITEYDHVRRAAMQRAVIHASTLAAETAYTAEGLTPDEILARAQAHYTALDVPTRGGAADMKQIANDLSDKLIEYHEQKRTIYGIRTGLQLIDRALNGLQRKKFVIVAGDPGNGKTALVHQILLNTGLDNVTAWLYSFEMDAQQVGMRMSCNLASVNANAVMRGALTDEEYASYQSALGRIAELPLIIHDQPCATKQIDIDLARAERRGELPSILAVDYSRLLTDTADTETLRVGQITRWGKITAQRFDLTLLMIHTLKGDAAREDRMPELRDLGWSRDAEYDADTVIATRIKDAKAAAALLKNREGEAGNGVGYPMVFVPQFTRWGDLANVPEPPRYTFHAPAPVWDLDELDERSDALGAASDERARTAAAIR